LFSRHRVLEAKKIALTREAGNNDKLTELLFGLNCLEIPCIQFFENSDVDRLSSEIKSNDIIVLTSPQGANVFLTHWGNLGQPNVKVAVVGTGTAQPLIIRGIKPVFQPSDFTGEALAKELPTDYGLKVLYPTSSLADNSLERGLKERGFQVCAV
jgi:uroporphyrinogen-III synthase